MNSNTQLENSILQRKKFFALRGRTPSNFFRKILIARDKYLKFLLIRYGVFSSAQIAKLYNGSKIQINVLDGGNLNIMCFGVLGKKEIPLIKYISKNLNSKHIFYDVGASYGYYSVLASSIVTSGKVYLFEPNTKLKPFVEKTNELNGNKIIINTIALADKTETRIFYDYSNFDSTISSLHKNKKYSSENYEVQVYTLDEFILQNDIPDFIKVDIESAEFDFLIGAKNFLENYAPTISLELKLLNESDVVYSKKCASFLLALGYKMFALSKDGDLETFDWSVAASEDGTAVSYINAIFKK